MEGAPPAYLEEGRYIELNSFDPDTNNTSETRNELENQPSKFGSWYTRNEDKIWIVLYWTASIFAGLCLLALLVLVLSYIIWAISYAWKGIFGHNKRDIIVPYTPGTADNREQQKRDDILAFLSVPDGQFGGNEHSVDQFGEKGQSVDQFWSEALWVAI